VAAGLITAQQTHTEELSKGTLCMQPTLKWSRKKINSCVWTCEDRKKTEMTKPVGELRFLSLGEGQKGALGASSFSVILRSFPNKVFLKNGLTDYKTYLEIRQHLHFTFNFNHNQQANR
jgi:hypothetical protein